MTGGGVKLTTSDYNILMAMARDVQEIKKVLKLIITQEKDAEEGEPSAEEWAEMEEAEASKE